MTRRSIVSHVARRLPFIVGGYLAACAAATFAGVLGAALIKFGGAVAEIGARQALLVAVVIVIVGLIPAVIMTVTLGAIPAALAVLLAEILRARAVWVYGFAGALTGAVAYFKSGTLGAPKELAVWLLLMVPAGLVGGLIYWLIAVHVGGRAATGNPIAGPDFFPTKVPL